MSKTLLMQTLRGIRFLRDIEPSYLRQIADIAEICDLKTNEVLFREGEAAEYVYLVVSGQLSLELSPTTIYHKLLVNVGPAEMLGWSSLVEHPRFAATVIAVEPTRLVRVDGRRLREMCDVDPRFGYQFMQRTMRALAERLVSTWSHLSHLYASQYLPVTTNLTSEAFDAN